MKGKGCLLRTQGTHGEYKRIVEATLSIVCGLLRANAILPNTRVIAKKSVESVGLK